MCVSRFEERRHDEVKNDLPEAQLECQFITPYRLGRAITMNGRTVEVDRIDRLRISKSEERSSALIAGLRAKDRESPGGGEGSSYSYRAAAAATDVTDLFVTGPPGTAERQPSPQTRATTSENTRRTTASTAPARSGSRSTARASRWLAAPWNG
jgi:hypothetical protein